MTNKPPPLPPPPVKLRGKEHDESSNTHWIIASAVILGALLALIIVPWIVVPSDLGLEGEPSRDGGSATVAASLGALRDPPNTMEATPTVSSIDGEANVQDEFATKTIEPKSQTDQVSNAESSEVEDIDPLRQKVEQGLLIVEKKRPSNFSSKTGSRSHHLGDLGGPNPFVGSGPPAKSTVYVIDVSGSMQVQDRLPRVISTLKRAIELLEPDQKFQVVLFDDSFHLHPVERGLLLATSKNKKTIYDWLDRGMFGSGTNPTPAMLFAVQQNPERVVLLSDGEFDPSSESVITRANQSNPMPAIIDCVGLMEEVETLKEIASSNNGIYYQAH